MTFPELGPAVRSLILADPSVVALVNTRVMSEVLPQDGVMPAVTYNVITQTGNNCLSGFPVGTDSATVQIDSYGNTRTEADNLSQTVLAAIAGFRGVVGDTYLKSVSQNAGRQYMTDRPDAATDNWRYRSIQDFNFVWQSTEKV